MLLPKAPQGQLDDVQGLLGPYPKVVNDLLEAMWSGCVSNSTSGRGREAAASAFTECLSWLLTQVTEKTFCMIVVKDFAEIWTYMDVWLIVVLHDGCQRRCRHTAASALEDIV